VAAQPNRLNQMRFFDHPENLIRNKHPMMFHSSGFAIAAGVVAVGAAVGSAAISMSAADRAKKGQGRAAKAYQEQQRQAVAEYEQRQSEVRGMINAVQAPQYNLGAMTRDAAKITQYNRQQIEKFQPGATALRTRSVGQINKAMDVTDQYLRGEIPQDVREQTMRNIAEFGGAGFNPEVAGRTGGFQAAQGLVPRQFGLTSLDLQGRGLAAVSQIQGTAMNWQQLSRAFISEPLDVGRVQLGFQTAAAEVGLQKAGLTSNLNTGLFNAKTGLSQNIYNANKENIAASYAAQQTVGQGVSDIGKATSGALMGMSNVSAAQQGLSFGAGGMGGGMGGMGGSGTGLGATPLYNTPYTFTTRADQYGQVATSRLYQGGQMTEPRSMSDRPVALPNPYTGR
jgi:hypothetical protein